MREINIETFKPSPGDKFYDNNLKKKGVVFEYLDESNWYYTISGSTEIIKAPFRPKDVKWLFIDGEHYSTYLK